MKPNPSRQTQHRLNRRQFVATAGAAAAALTVVPRHVLGGPRHVPPSEEITLAYIGCGTQGFRQLTQALQNSDINVVAVCG